MLSSFWISTTVGTVLGALSGLGVGGGSLLILWLTIVLGIEQSTARGINLLFFVPAAIVTCCFRFRQGVLRMKIILPAVITGTIAAAVLSWITLDSQVLKKGFGILLLVTGLRELLYKKK